MVNVDETDLPLVFLTDTAGRKLMIKFSTCLWSLAFTDQLHALLVVNG